MAPRRSGTNFIIRDTRQPIIRQFNNPSVILMRAASSPNFGNSVNATRSLMAKLRTSDHPVVGTPLKDIIDVRCLVGSLHCDHISNHWEGTQRIDYRFGRHFTDYLGVDIDVAPFDLDVIFQRLDAFDRDHGLIFGMRLNHATVKQHKAKDVARTLTRQLIQRDGIYNGIKITAHGDEIVFNALDRARMTEKPEQTIPLRSVA